MTNVQTTSANGIELAYETFGSPTGRPLLLVMGLAVQMLAWPDELCRMLADRAFRVARFDNRDIGLSTHLSAAGSPSIEEIFINPAAAAPYNLDAMADDTAALLDALDMAPAHVVGASMGGMIAQQTAARHPSKVRSLTSIMSTPSPTVGQPTEAAMAALLAPPATDRAEAIDRAVATLRVIGSPGFPFVEEMVRDVAGRSYDRAYDPAGVLRQLAAIQASGDRTAVVATVQAPTLVLHGEADVLVQLAGGQATAAAIAGAELVTYPGMGHDLPQALWPDFVERIVALADRADAAA